MRLVPGSIVKYDPNSGCLSAFTGSEPEHWAGGDDKFPIPALRTRFDLDEIVRIIAASHGLRIKKVGLFTYELVRS